MIYVGITLCAGTVFLLLVAEQFAKRRIQPEAEEPDPPAWIDERAHTETDPGRRTAWRMIRDQHLENPWQQ